MKVCFVGIGSIAKRHISNLREIAANEGFNLKIDAVRRKGSDGSNDGIDSVYYCCESLSNDYDIIFITNPTEFHIDTLKKVAGKSKNFFIEKPLTSVRTIEAAYEFNPEPDALYYVACPLRYTAVIQHLKKYVGENKIIGARCISSSYLPQWRVGVDYRNTYSAHKELGGGVSVDLIHEWDYLKFLFGDPKKVMYASGKKSSLEIDCEDTALYIAEYEDKFVELHLDYFGRKTVRETMLFTEEETVLGDLVNSRVLYLRSGKVIDFNEKRNDFQKNELYHFFDLIKVRQSDNDIENAYKTILLTQGIVRDN